MANRDNPHGLQLIARTLSGGDPFIQRLMKDSSEGAAIFINDAVNRQDDGNIEANSATPGTTLYSGVNLGPYGAASTETYHMVCVSPDALYEIQDNGETDGVAAVDLGLNGNIELNAGSATTKYSGHELDESTIDTTNSLDLHLLAKHDVPDNDYGAWCRVEVVFNKHRMAPGVAGV